MSDAYEVAHLDELEALPVPGASARLAIRERFAVGAFGVNAYRAAEAGKQVIEEHDELGPSAAGHEELYLVLSGRATFTVAGEEVDAPTGTVLFVQPEIRRGAVAREPGTTVLVLGGSRGQPFTPGAWEQWAGLWPLYERGDYEACINYLHAVLRRLPGHATVLYNLACCEALAGRSGDALKHLRETLEADPRFRQRAREDADFASLRGDPAFAALLR